MRNDTASSTKTVAVQKKLLKSVRSGGRETEIPVL